VYNRGQDSTGILIYEQSHRNVFAYNSATHGGDGFFLWAGQTTMDTGKGGCNDNVLYGNDFSHSPANGIEATFSRNVFVNNLMLECWHGIWGGYSYESKVVGNVFGYNQEAIAWEHGQDNVVDNNVFLRDNEAIVIWSNPSQDPNWGYAKHRDTRSRDWTITNNEMLDTFQNVFRLRRSQNVGIKRNIIFAGGRVLVSSEEVTGLAVTDNEIFARQEEPLAKGQVVEIIGPNERRWPSVSSLSHDRTSPRSEYLEKFKVSWDYSTDPRPLARAGRQLGQEEERLAACAPFFVPARKGGIMPFLQEGAVRGWRYILVDEWGPYDFKRPILWPRGEDAEGRQVYEVLGPIGEARPITLLGVTVEGISEDGKGWTVGAGQLGRMPVPGYVRFGLKPGSASNVRVEFEYVGEETTDVRGIVTPKGKPVRFGFRKFHAPIDWEVKWFAYDKATEEPRTMPEAFAKLLAEGAPVKAIKTARLDFNDGYEGIPRDHYATLAIGKVALPPGEYVLNVTSDDGVRVWIDGKLVIDNWTWHGPTLDKASLSGGAHTIRVEHFEIDGYSTLKVDIQPKG
jgi:hypothetical protein